MIWPFRKRKSTEPVSPAINEDWAVGDLAECISDGPWVPNDIGPIKGEVRRVTRVGQGRKAVSGEDGWFLGLVGYRQIYDALDFRKVVPRADVAERCDASFITLLTGKPVKVDA